MNTCTLARVRFRLRRGVGLGVRVRVGLGVRVGFGVHTMHQSPHTPARCRRFPGRVLVTERHCGSERCDFRDCEGMRYSLIDMMNLARTRLILGSGTAATHHSHTPWLARVLPRQRNSAHPISSAHTVNRQAGAHTRRWRPTGAARAASLYRYSSLGGTLAL